MRYVILFTPHAIHVDDLISRAPEMGWIHQQDREDRIDSFSGTAEGQRIWIEQCRDRDIENDWQDEPERLARIRAMGDGRNAYFVHFQNARQLKLVLAQIADDPDFLIDDDFDLFVRGDEFANLVRTASDGNWLMQGYYP